MTTELEDVITRWTESERSGDAATLDALLTDDFVGIGPVGFTLDKQAWLSRFDQGLSYDHLELDEVSIRRHGDAAIVVAHQHAQGMARETPTPPDTRVSFVLVPDADQVRIAGVQYSFIGAPLAPDR
jgi:ketosteroid isomerase-like protein